MNTFRLFAPVVSQPTACQETAEPPVAADDAAAVEAAGGAAGAVAAAPPAASPPPPLPLPPPWALPPVDAAGLVDPLDERSPFHGYFLRSVLPQWCMAEPDCGAGEGWGAPETAAAKAKALEAPAVGAVLAELLGDGIADLREGGEFDLTCIDAADVDGDGDGAPQQKKPGRRTRCQVAAARLASELVASASGSGRASKRRRVQRRARVVVPEAAAAATAANGVDSGAYEHCSDDDVVSEDLLSQTQPSGLVDADDGAADAASDASASDAGDAATLAASARDIVALLCDDNASGGGGDGGAADVVRRRYCAPPPADADAALTRLSPRDAAASARLHRAHLRPLHTRLRQAAEADAAAADDAAEKKNGNNGGNCDGDDPMGEEEEDASADVPSAALCAAVEAFSGYANFFSETSAAFAADPSAAASAEDVSGRRVVLAVYCELGGIVALLLLLLARRQRRQRRRTLRPSPPSAARGAALVSAFLGRLAGDDFFLSRVTLVPLLRVTEAAEAAWRAEHQQASAFALLASSAANRACVRSFLSSVAALAEERGAAGEETLPAELRGAVAGAALRGVFVLPAALGRHNPVLGPCLRAVCGVVRASVATDAEEAAEEAGATAGDGVLESLGGDVARALSQGLSLEASAVDVAATVHSGTPVRSAVVKAAAAAAEAGGGGVATSPLAELLTGVCEGCCGGGSASGLRAAGRIAREVLAAVLACCAGEGAPRERAARKAALASVWNVTDALCARADLGSVAATYVLAVLVKCLVGAAAPPPPPPAEDEDEEGGGAKRKKKKKKATKKTAGSLAGCTDADLQMILRCLSRVAATLSAHHAQLVDSVLPCAEAAVLAGDAFFALYLSRDNPHATERQKDVLRACLRAGGGGGGDGGEEEQRRHRQLAGSLSDEGWRRVSFLATRFFRFSAFKCCSVPALLDRLVQVLLRQGGGAGVACRRQAVRQVSALLRLPAPPAEAHAAAVARIGGAGSAVAAPPSIDLRMYTLSLFLRAVGQPSPLIREAALDLVPLVRGSAASADNPLCVEALLGLLGAERSATVVRKTVDLLAEEVVAKATPSAPVRLRVLRQVFRALAPLLREEQEAAAAAAATAAPGGRGGGGTQEHRLKVAVVKLAERLWMASLCGDEGASAECGAQEAAALWGGAGVAAAGGDEDVAPLAGRHACVREIGSLCVAGGAAVEDAMVRVLAGCVVAAAGSASVAGGRSTGDVVQALYDAASSNLERPAMQEPCSLFLRVVARVDGLVHTGEALVQQQQRQRQQRYQRAAAGVATRRTATLILVGKHLARRLEEGVQQRRMEPATLACVERLLDAMRHVFSAQRSAGLLLPAAAAADGGESPAFVAGHVLPLLGGFVGAAPSQAVLAAAVGAVCSVPYVVRAPPPACLAFVHPAAAQMATNLLEAAVRLLENVSKALAGDGDEASNDDEAESESAESVNSAEEEASETLAVFGRRMRRWRQRAKQRGDGSSDDDDADADSGSSAESSELDDLPDAVTLLCKRLFVAGEVLKNFAYTGLLCDAMPPGRASDARLAVLDRCVAAASAALAGLDVSAAAAMRGGAAAAPFPAERRRLVPLLCLVAVSACGHDPFRFFRTLRPTFEGLVARCTDEARRGDVTSALGPACLQIAKGLTHHVRQEAERVAASAQHATVYLTRDDADPAKVVAATSAATVDASGVSVGVSCIACELSHVYLAPVAELSLVAAAAGQPALRSACVGFVHACAEQSLASPVALAPALVAHASLAGEACGASSVAAASLHLLGTLAKGSFRGEVVSRMGVGIAAAFYLQPSPEEASGFASAEATGVAGAVGTGAPPRTSLFSPLHALLAATPSAAEKLAEVFAHLLRRTVLSSRGVDEGSSSDPFDVGSLAGLPSPPQAAPSADITLGELRRVLHLFRFLLEAAATLPFHKRREVLRLITAVDLHVDAAAELLLASVAAAAPPRGRGRPRKGVPPPPQHPWAALLAACGLAFGLVFARRAAERYGLTTRQVRRYADGDGGGEGAAAVVRRQRANGGDEAEDGERDEDVADAMSVELRELVAKIEAAVMEDAPPPPPPAAEDDDESSSGSSGGSSSGSSNGGGDGDGEVPDGRVIGTRQRGAGVAAWRCVSGYLDEALSERSKRSLAYGGGGRKKSKTQTKKRGRGRRRAASSTTESASSSTESSATSSASSSDESSSDSEVRVAALRRVPRVALTPTKGAQRRQQRRRVAGGGGGDVSARLDLEELASSGRSGDDSSS